MSRPAAQAKPCENCGHIKKSHSKRGPKPFVLDDEKIAKMNELFSAGCTIVEVASHLGTGAETFAARVKQRFGVVPSEYKQKYFYSGDADIRKAQYDLGVKDKDRGMLIWLGKNRLGQSDNPKLDEQFSGDVAKYLDHLHSLPVDKGPVPGLRGKPSQLAERDKYRTPTFEPEAD